MLQLRLGPGCLRGPGTTRQTLLKPTREDLETCAVESPGGCRQLGDHLIAFPTGLNHGYDAAQLPMGPPKAAKDLRRVLLSDFHSWELPLTSGCRTPRVAKDAQDAPDP